jgi:hypothetical protein
VSITDDLQAAALAPYGDPGPDRGRLGRRGRRSAHPRALVRGDEEAGARWSSALRAGRLPRDEARAAAARVLALRADVPRPPQG